MPVGDRFRRLDYASNILMEFMADSRHLPADFVHFV
jgi:hypothetical protein